MTPDVNRDAVTDTRAPKMNQQLVGVEPIGFFLEHASAAIHTEAGGSATNVPVQVSPSIAPRALPEVLPPISLSGVLADQDELALVRGLFLFALNREPVESDYAYAAALREESAAGWIGVIAELLRQDSIDRLGVDYRNEVTRQVRLITIAGLCLTGGESDNWLISNSDFIFAVAAYRVARGFGPSLDEWHELVAKIEEGHGREWLLRGLWSQSSVRNRVRGTGSGLRSRWILKYSRWFSLGVFRAHVTADMSVVTTLLVPLFDAFIDTREITA